MKQLNQEQKDIIRKADDAIIYLEDQLHAIGMEKFSDEAPKNIEIIKDFICWSLNNIRK